MIGWSEPHPTKFVSSIPDLSGSVSGIRLCSKHEEVRTGNQADLRFRRLPVQPQRGEGQTHLETWADLKLKNSKASHQALLSGQAARVAHRPVNDWTKASPPRLTPHKANPVAPEKSMEDPRFTRKCDSNPKMSLPHLKRWLQDANVL